jgi:hypothetical protein
MRKIFRFLLLRGKASSAIALYFRTVEYAGYLQQESVFITQFLIESNQVALLYAAE